MKFIIISLFLVFGSTIFAADHPAEEAEAKLAAATKSLQTTIQRVDKAIKRIDDRDKQKTTAKAFSETQKKWKTFTDSEATIYLAATPAPEGSTGAMLTAYYTETSITEGRIKELRKLAEWLETNYK